MWYQFFWENIHFAINLFSALAFFSVFWLYLDAWSERKTLKEGLKITGFLLLAIAFLIESTRVTSNELVFSIFGASWNEYLSLGLRNIGYLLLGFGLLIDPLLKKPVLFGGWPGGLVFSRLATPLLSVSCAWLFLRRATLGLENHTKKVALAFYFFSGFELMQIPLLFNNSTNVDIFKTVAVFGPVWILGLCLELIGSAILIKWAFSYLLKRINSQLFIIITTLILSIFLLTTVSFSYLLLKNISNESLLALETDSSVLTFALNSKKSETLAEASVLASNQKLVEAIIKLDKNVIFNEVEKMLIDKKMSSIIVTNESGVVLARAEDKDRIGDSLSNNQLFKKSINGQEVATLITVDQVVAPEVQIKVSKPIIQGNKIVGVVFMSMKVDNVFLDEIKKNTGLELGIFGGDILAATTVTEIEGGRRPLGIKETNSKVIDQVINNGNNYKGVGQILNTDYFMVYRPLIDNDKNIIGTMQVSRLASSIYVSAGKTVEMTFVVVGILILVSIFPTFIISKYISDQIK